MSFGSKCKAQYEQRQNPGKTAFLPHKIKVRIDSCRGGVGFSDIS
jgi:hypothetical protein